MIVFCPIFKIVIPNLFRDPIMMKQKDFYVYILSNEYNSVFYIGVTNSLERRILEHKEGTIDGFAKKYNTKKLVYFEQYPDADSSIRREKQLKNWHRDWKINLIKKINPELRDLTLDIGDPEKISG